MKQWRKLDQLMLSLLDKEATYDAGPGGWTGMSAVQVKEFGEAYVDWPDVVVTDAETIHGSQYPTVSEILYQDVRIAYSEARVRPVALIGLCALAGGVLAAPVQDGALVAYRQKVTPVGAATGLPSIGAQAKEHGIQYKYTGIRADSLRLFKSGDFWGIDVPLIGSGTRATAADGFPAFGADLPLRFQDSLCWLETGANISIDAAPVQGAENISSATPDVLSGRLKNAEFRWGNDLAVQDGYAPGGGKVRTRLDHGNARGGSVMVQIEVDPATYAAEQAYYDDQVACALEIECKSPTLIAAGGAMFYGFDLIVPRFYLKAIARAVVDGYACLTYAADLFDDLVNPPWIFYGYSAVAAFLA